MRSHLGSSEKDQQLGFDPLQVANHTVATCQQPTDFDWLFFRARKKTKRFNWPTYFSRIVPSFRGCYDVIIKLVSNWWNLWQHQVTSIMSVMDHISWEVATLIQPARTRPPEKNGATASDRVASWRQRRSDDGEWKRVSNTATLRKCEPTAIVKPDVFKPGLFQLTTLKQAIQSMTRTLTLATMKIWWNVKSYACLEFGNRMSMEKMHDKRHPYPISRGQTAKNLGC